MISSSALAQEPVVVSVGNAIVTAQEQARLVGFDFGNKRISIRQELTDDGATYWRVEFTTFPPPGVSMRVGGFMTEVNANDGSVRRALFLQ